MKTHKQELLDLAHDIGHADEVILARLTDDRAPAVLPEKYVKWIIDALNKAAWDTWISYGKTWSEFHSARLARPGTKLQIQVFTSPQNIIGATYEGDEVAKTRAGESIYLCGEDVVIRYDY